MSSTSYVFEVGKLRAASSDANNVVLVACGSFSPITNLHLRMFEMARDAIEQDGTSGYGGAAASADASGGDVRRTRVLGGFISPVADAYGKKSLVSATHRLEMVRRAVASSDWLACDAWEAEQGAWSTTRAVLRHFASQLAVLKARVRVQLVCGSDLLDSFNVPDLWARDDMEFILREHGVVVVERAGTNAADVVFQNPLLYAHRHCIHIVKQYVSNEISSTLLRSFVERRLSIKYLTPDAVVDYIHQNKLFL